MKRRSAKQKSRDRHRKKAGGEKVGPEERGGGIKAGHVAAVTAGEWLWRLQPRHARRDGQQKSISRGRAAGSPKQRAKKIPGRPGAGANSRLVVAAPASVPVVVVVVVVVVVAVAVVLPTTAPATAAAPAALLLLRGTWTVSVVAVFNTN